MILVSVIIPVYNAQEYLAICIESLLCQSLKQCEFIFVNDGSTDLSLQIIESFQLKDARISIINQINKGVSQARNEGINKASGTFLSFIDADDYVENNFLEKLYTSAITTNAEIVTSNFNTEINGKLIKNLPLFATDKLFEYNEIQSQILPFFIEQDLLNTACNKLYSANLIKSNRIVFPINVTNGEDGLFNIMAFNSCKLAIFIDVNGYFYRDVANSATRNSSKTDYFKIALEKYAINYKKEYNLSLDDDKVAQLKSIRLINNVISLIHIYLNSKAKTSFIYKYKYVSAMISNADVQLALKKYWIHLYNNQPKYQQFILYCIKLKSVLLLFLATSYSNFRNK